MAIVKPVSFKEKEQDLIDFIGKRDFSYYVKELIRKDKNNSETSISSKKENKPKPRRNTNFEI